MSFAMKVAWRFVRSNRAQSIFIVLSIAVGVSVQIFIGLLIQGLQRDLVEKTVGNSSQVTVVSANQGPIGNWEELVKKIKETDGYGKEIKALSVSADTPVFITKGNRIDSVLLRGFDFADADPIYKMSSSVVNGSLPSSDGEIAVGKVFAQDFGISPGERITVFTADRKLKSLLVSGIFDLGVSNLNKSWILSNLGTARDVGSFGNGVTSVEMQVYDVFNADKTAGEVSAALDSTSVKVENWKAQNRDLLSALQGQSFSSVMIQVFILVAVTLAIASVLAITVMQKSKQIGILKAMGLKDGTTSLVFLFQGVLLGVMGAFLGVAIGLALSLVFTTFAVSDGRPIVPFYINYGFIALSFAIAVCASLIAAVVPARKSSKLSPVEVIRNG